MSMFTLGKVQMNCIFSLEEISMLPDLSLSFAVDKYTRRQSGRDKYLHRHAEPQSVSKPMWWVLTCGWWCTLGDL